MRNVFFAPGALPANVLDPELIRTKTLAHAEAVKTAYGDEAIVALDTSIWVCGASIIGEIHEHCGLRVLADLKFSDSFHVLRHYLLSLSEENAPEFLTISPMAGTDTAKWTGDLLSSTKLYASGIVQGFQSMYPWSSDVAKFAQHTPGVFEGIVCFGSSVRENRKFLNEDFRIIASGAYHTPDDLDGPRLGGVAYSSVEECDIYIALSDAEDEPEETRNMIHNIKHALAHAESAA